MVAEHIDPQLLLSLVAIGRAASEEFDPRRFLEESSGGLQALIPHDRLVIDHLDEDGRTVTVFAEHAPPDLSLHEDHCTTAFAPQARYIVKEWVLKAVFDGEALLVHDFSNDPRVFSANPFERKLLKAGIRSGVAVPLESGGRTIGALVATSLAAHVYTEAHLGTLRQVANLIGPFVENTFLLHRERERRRRLRALGTLTEALARSLDARDVFGHLAAAVKPILDFDVIRFARRGGDPRPSGRPQGTARFSAVGMHS